MMGFAVNCDLHRPDIDGLEQRDRRVNLDVADRRLGGLEPQLLDVDAGVELSPDVNVDAGLRDDAGDRRHRELRRRDLVQHRVGDLGVGDEQHARAAAGVERDRADRQPRDCREHQRRGAGLAEVAAERRDAGGDEAERGRRQRLGRERPGRLEVRRRRQADDGLERDVTAERRGREADVRGEDRGVVASDASLERHRVRRELRDGCRLELQPAGLDLRVDVGEPCAEVEFVVRLVLERRALDDDRA